MNRETIDQWLEWGILGLVLCILAFGPLATGAVRVSDFVVIQGLTIGVVGLWIARVWLGKNHRLLCPPICWAVLAFGAYALYRYRSCDIEYVGRMEWIRVLIYALLFFAIVQNLHHQDAIQIIIYVLLALGTGISLYAIYQFATNSPYVWHFIKPEGYMKRATGTYICPNHLAGFLEMILPLGLAYVFLGRFKPVTKVFIAYASLMILAGIGMTISRGGWIATGISMAVFFAILIRNPNHRIPAIVFLALLVCAGSVFVAKAEYSKERFAEMFVAGKLENIRFRLWRPALEMWEQNPWLGVGPGHFDYRFNEFRPKDVQMRPDRVHNDYLNTLADWGIVGVILVSAAWVLLYHGAFKTWKYVQRTRSDFGSKKSNKPALLLGAGIGLLAILLHSVVDFNLNIPANAILAITLMALLSSHIRFATDRFWIRSRWYVKTFVSLIALLAAGYLAQQWVLRVRELRLWQFAHRQPEYSAPRLATLLKEFEVEPRNYRTAQEIAETYRVESWQGDPETYRELAEKAMNWFQTAMRLNPYDYYNYLRYGMCLHWIGRHQEAQTYFDRAEHLDPNGYFTLAHIGWHWMQLKEYAKAKPYFQQSLQLRWEDNPVAVSYLKIIEKKLAEASGNK